MTMRRMAGLRYQTLFVALVLLYLAPGELFDGTIGRLVGFATASLVLFAVLYASGAQRRRLLIGTVLGVPFVVLEVARAFWPGGSLEVAAAIVEIVFLGYVVWTLIDALLGRDEVLTDAIFAAACAYLLIGITWALGYVIVDRIAPGSFQLPAGSGSLAREDAMYFSLVTLTTLGYGDVFPVRTFAQRLATMEAVVGVLYLAVVVSRLVAAVRWPRKQDRS